MKFKNLKTFILLGLIVGSFFTWQAQISSSGAPPFVKHQKPSFHPVLRLPSAQEVTGSEASRDHLLILIRETKECYKSETCDFPNTDPKSYDISVGQKLKVLLTEYHNSYGKDLKNKVFSERLAQEFIQSTDEYVQEVAIKIFSELPPSAENLRSLTDSLQGTTDPLLVNQAMNEMKRYLGTDQEPSVHEFLREILAHGGVFSSEKAVQKILPFINPKSFSGYQEVSGHLPAHSTVGKDLRTALDEYRRLQSGG